MITIEEDYGTILIGENKNENWQIIDESAKNDIWFHIENFPSCHVIFSAKDGYIVSKKDIKYIANICKIHTKKCSFLKNTRVNYTEIKNIRKGHEIGSVIMKKFNTVKV